MEEIIIEFDYLGRNIGTRFAAVPIRQRIEKIFNETEKIIFDLTGIDHVSESFADESYARLLEKFEKQDIENKINFKNADPFQKAVFRKMLKNRSEGKQIKP